MNFSDYVLENLKLKEEISDLYTIVAGVVQAWDNYEHRGAISDFEGQPLIYASVLEDLFELTKRVRK